MSKNYNILGTLRLPRGNVSLTGFTVLELVVYIAVLSTVLSAVLAFVLWSVKSETKTQTMRQVVLEGQRAMNVLGHSIAGAQSIYAPTSIFDASPGQLSLQTSEFIPGGEQFSYIDFYVCEQKLCMKRESQETIAITSGAVSLTNLVFQRIATEKNSAVKIVMTLGKHDSVLTLYSTFSLRSYVQ